MAPRSCYDHAMAGKKSRKPNNAKASDWMYASETDAGKAYLLRDEAREVLEAWGRKGLTKDEIAENMGVSRSTLAAWQKKCPDISDAIKNARAYACARVENALFKKAVGYTYELDGKKIVVPPDLGAIIFFLTNRLPKDWQNNRPYTGDEKSDRGEIVFMRQLSHNIAKELKAPKDEKPEEQQDKLTDAQD